MNRIIFDANSWIVRRPWATFFRKEFHFGGMTFQRKSGRRERERERERIPRWGKSELIAWLSYNHVIDCLSLQFTASYASPFISRKPPSVYIVRMINLFVCLCLSVCVSVWSLSVYRCLSVCLSVNAVLYCNKRLDLLYTYKYFYVFKTNNSSHLLISWTQLL